VASSCSDLDRGSALSIHKLDFDRSNSRMCMVNDTKRCRPKRGTTMTNTTARTDFAERGGGTGVVIAPKRTDFADPEVRASDQAQLIRRVAAHVENGTTDLADEVLFVDPAEFCDPERLEAERDLFFRRTPQLAAYSAELPGPNTYTTKDIAGVPVVITRDANG